MRPFLHPSLFFFFLVALLLVPSASARNDAGDLTITGRVLDPDGAPAPGVEVRLEPVPDLYARARMWLEGVAGAPPVAAVRTDDEGYFALRAPRIGMWDVAVEVDGFVPMTYPLDPLIRSVGLPALRLERAREIAVRVTDTGGEPVTTWVGAPPSPADEPGGWRIRMRLGRTGEDGTLRLPRAEDERIWLQALAGKTVIEDVRTRSVELEVPGAPAGTVRVIDGRRRGAAEVLAFRQRALLPFALTDAGGLLRYPAREPIRLRAADGWIASFDPAARAPGETEAIPEVQLEPPPILDGRVIDATSGDPIADAVVWRDRETFTTTDAHGRYRLVFARRIPSGLQAAADGYTTAYSRRDADDLEPLTFSLTPTASVSGRVVDAAGQPLRDVAVYAVNHGERCNSDRDGGFELTGIAPGAHRRLRFIKPGFSTAEIALEPLEPHEARAGIEAVLHPGRVAFGRVVDEDEAPVAGARVELTAEGILAGPWWAETDAAGRFEVPDLSAGRYGLTVDAGGFAPRAIRGLEIAAETRTDFGPIVLARGSVLEGRVEDREGRPIEGARIDARLADFHTSHLRGRHQSASATTDAEGRFVLEGLIREAKLSLTVAKPDYAAQQLDAVAGKPVTIVLEPAARLDGKVLGPDGEPISAALVAASPDPQQPAARPSGSYTDAEGAFEIADLTPGVVTLTVEAEGFRQYRRTGLAVAAESETLEIVLEPATIVRGTVRDADGVPVSWASVRIRPVRGFRDGLGVVKGGTDAEGRFVIEEAPLGVAVIEASKAYLRTARPIEVRSGVQEVELVLGRGFTISGRVVDERGLPVSGIGLTLGTDTRISYGSADETSAADGAFRFAGISPGRYRVAADGEGYAGTITETFTVESGDVDDLEIVLARGVTLTGRILGVEPDELSTVALHASGPSSGNIPKSVDADGSYRIEDLVPGEWRIGAHLLARGLTTSEHIVIEEGETAPTLDLEFTPGLALTGVVTENGQPFGGATLVVSGGSRGLPSATSGRDGRFRLGGLETGTYRLRVSWNAVRLYETTLEIEGDREIRVEVTTAAVAGRVRDAEDGEPIADARVRLESAEPPAAPLHFDETTPLPDNQPRYGGQARTDSHGRFVVPRLPPGRWRLTVDHPGYSSGEQTVEVVASVAPEELELSLRPVRWTGWR